MFELPHHQELLEYRYCVNHRCPNRFSKWRNLQAMRLTRGHRLLWLQVVDLTPRRGLSGLRFQQSALELLFRNSDPIRYMSRVQI
jgi:hypothetical protein